MLRNRMLGLRFAKSNKRQQLRKGIKFRTSRPRNVQLLKAIVSVMPSRLHTRIASTLETFLIGSSAYQNSQIEMDVVTALDIILRNKYPDWKNELPVFYAGAGRHNLLVVIKFASRAQIESYVM